MDKDLRNRLYWLNEELTEQNKDSFFEEEEEPEYIEPPRRRGLSRAERFEREKLEELDPLEKRSAPVIKKRGSGRFLLTLLIILAILLVIGWWFPWQI